jgi:lipopolysaccharide export system protein LptA
MRRSVLSGVVATIISSNMYAMTKLSLVSLIVSLLVFASPTHAERADRNKPINFEADSLKYDDIKQVQVLQGAVVITKGTLVVRGERVEVRQDPNGFDYATATAKPGERVSYRQKRDAVPGEPEEFFEGYATQMVYDGKADTVKLVGNASVRRLRNGALSDEAVGELITIENATATYTITGGGRGGTSASPNNPKGRVQGMFSPRGASSAAAPPATPSSGKLKPSTSLQGN